MNSFCLFSNWTEERLTTNTVRTATLSLICSRGNIRQYQLAPSIPGQRFACKQGCVAYSQNTGHVQHSQVEQGRPEANLDLLAEKMEKGQKNVESRREGKTRICNSNPFIPEGLMEQLLAIALVHFNTLTVRQLLVIAPSARGWSADHLLLLLYDTKSDRTPREP